MRTLLTLLALAGVVLTVNGTALAAISVTIDGSIAEWTDPNYLHTDAELDGAGQADVVNWGCYYQSTTKTDPGYFYWFCEAGTAPGGLFEGYNEGDNDSYTGLWIDVDHYSGPVTLEWGPWRIRGNGLTDYQSVVSSPSGFMMSQGWAPAEWSSPSDPNYIHLGLDVEPELGINTAHWGEGYNYWGKYDIAGAQGAVITVDSPKYATSGPYLEARVPIDDMIAEVLTYPDAVADNFRNGEVNGLWKVALRIEASTGGVGPWGVDATYAIYVPIIADGNDDGRVDLLDFQLIQSGYNKTFAFPGSWEKGDYNLDGKVDLLDFQFLQTTYLKNIYDLGPTGSAGAVPEPITLVLLGLGGLLLRRRR